MLPCLWTQIGLATYNVVAIWCYILLSVYLFSSAALAETNSTSEVNLEEIYAAQSRRLSIIRSLDFQAAVTRDRTNELPADTRNQFRSMLPEGTFAQFASKTITYKQRFQLQGELYRTDYTVSNTDGVEIRAQSNLFNGERFLEYDPTEKSAFARKQRNLKLDPYGISLPLLDPFAFTKLSPEDPITFQGLSQPQFWNKLTEVSREIGVGELDGEKVIIVEVQHPEPSHEGTPFTFRVFFSIAYDYYPIQVEKYHSEKLVSRFRASKITKVATLDGSEVLMHAHGLSEHWNVNGELATTFTSSIDLDLIKINDKIPKENFNLDITELLMYIDRVDASKSFDYSQRNPALPTEIQEAITHPMIEPLSMPHKLPDNQVTSTNAKESQRPLGVWRLFAILPLLALGLIAFLYFFLKKFRRVS